MQQAPSSPLISSFLSLDEEHRLVAHLYIHHIRQRSTAQLVVDTALRL